ncbi:hypothetical protein [Nocardia sp. CY41]|uniref:hypothetical protein n=1 Tax=Nocardia sp. CY41 TaxID=2608686 RepID=UPI00135CC594|nr:hypothetical protein [Nocardia sp. CY41]
MVDMHPMLMPDRKKIQEGNYPAEWVFSVFTDSCFKSLYQNFDGIWKSLGKDSKSDPPKAPDVPQVAPANIGSFTNYAEVAVQLQRSYTDLNGNVTELVKSVRESGKWSEAGQDATNKVIDEKIVAMARTAPPQGIQIDSYILTWVTEANDSLASEIDVVRQGQSGVAKDIDDQTKMIKDLQDHISKLEAAQKNPGLNPPPIDTGQWPPGLTNPPSTDATLPPGLDGLDGLDDPDNSGLTPPGLNDPGLDTPGVDNGLNPRAPGGIDPIGTTPGVTTPPTPAVPPASAMSPMGSGMDLMSSMLPMMMQQAMMRNMADQDLNSRRRDLDPSRYDDELDAVAPPPIAPPVTAQPAVAQPSTTAPATQHATAPTGTTSTQPAVAPGRTPDADGSVTYTFPDGRTQKVSAMVAQALDAAFGNHADTNAQQAYEKTPAKWSTEPSDKSSQRKRIGKPVGDFELMTGDVATWTNSTAVLVVFPPDQGGTLEVIVKGELKPFDPKMPEIASETNVFDGFAHPNGIEVTAPADRGSSSGTPGSADQSANATMPDVATIAG